MKKKHFNIDLQTLRHCYIFPKGISQLLQNLGAFNFQ